VAAACVLTDPVRDEDAAVALWQRSLPLWPIARAEFAGVIGDALVATVDRQLAGFAAVAHRGRRGSLPLLLVDRDRRRCGLGRRLHDAALDHLRRRGADTAGLGGTPGPYLWPGLPADLDDARAILDRWGWRFGYRCWDLVRDLSDYETPREVAARASAYSYRWASGADRERLAAFEARHFPSWGTYLNAGLDSAIVGVDEAGEIVGSLIARDQRHPPLWRELLGDDSGTIGAVGVAERARGRGVGTAMVAYACEQLRDRGVGNCHVGWTTELSFYGRLRFRHWRRYDTAQRSL
jgi:GNAT superfamily N-acetyltransferase